MLTPDTLFALACLLIGVLLPVIPVVLITRRARRQLGTATAYRELARALDLDVDTRGMSLHGVRDDRPLWVGVVLVGEGSERRRQEVHGVIGFRQPLGLGLEIRTRRNSREGDGATLGDPQLDKRLVVSTVHPEGLDAVRSEAVIEALSALVPGVKHLQLVDARLRVRLGRSPSTVAELGQLVEQLERAAIALEASAAHVPPPELVRAWLPQLEALATDHGLQMDASRIGVHGSVSGWPIEIVPHHVRGRWTCWLAVRFAPEVDTGLRVHPQRSERPDGQDIRLGDPVFDPAFVIKGYDPEAVRARLVPPVRLALSGLDRLGSVSLDDHALVVRELPPGCIAAALSHASAIAEQWSVGHADVRVIDV